MSCQRCGIGHNDVIADLAIVCHMTVSHDEVMAADHGDSVTTEGAAVQADELPEDIVIAYPKIGCFPVEFQILRICSHGTVAEEMASFPNGCPSLDGDMGVEPCPGPDLRIGAEDAVWADVSFGGDLAGIIDYGCRMYGHF
jgi:hypothetical protein